MPEKDEDERIKVKVPEYVVKLIPKFMKNRAEDIKKIKSSLKEKDFETIERLGHSMKGSGSVYGFDEISEIGKLIEESAKKESTREIKENLKKLNTYIERVEVVNE